MSHYVAESLLGTTLSIFGMRGQLSEALRIINCLRALARVFMIEDPCSPDSSGQEIFDRKEVCRFQIRSLTPQ